MTDTRRPAPAGAGRRVQPRLDESLTGSVSHEMSTSDLSAAMPGRHHVGTVAGFRLESVADFVGIHIRRTQMISVVIKSTKNLSILLER